MPSVAPTPAVSPVTPRSDTGAEALVQAALSSIAKLASTPGAPVSATVVGPLPNGLTQLVAGNRNLALQLTPRLAPGATVTLSLQVTADGATVVVRPTSAPQQSQARPTVQAALSHLPAPSQSVVTVTTSAVGQKAPSSVPQRLPPTEATGGAVAAARPNPATVRTDTSSSTITVPMPASSPAPTAAAPRGVPQLIADDTPSVPGSVAESSPETDLPGRIRSAADAYAGPKQGSPSASARGSTSAPPAAAAMGSLSSSEQQIVDPQQAVTRQQSATPLVARLAAVIARPDLPPRLREAAVKVLSARIGLDAGAPDAQALRAAIEGSGIFATPGGNDRRAALFALRAALLPLVGPHGTPGLASLRATPAPPLAGEPPQRGEPLATATLDGDRLDVARQLLGHAEGALSRLKLLQLASQPVDQRPQTPSAAAEYRVEIPMLLRGETAMVQFVIEREAREKAKSRERGWRMRISLSFSATGEVGADVGLYGRTVNVALWADDPATSEAFATAAMELAPSLARHGISLGAVRIRLGRPVTPGRASGAILDSTG